MGRSAESSGDIAGLLEQRTDAALEKAGSLVESSVRRSRSPDRLMLLAAIQFSQGLAKDRGTLLTAAYELIAEAGRRGAPQPVVDFNRGVVLTSLGLWQEAKRAYGQSLDGDAVSGWAGEARQRIRELEALEREQLARQLVR